MFLMVLCDCACANLVLKANLNLINRIDLFTCLHIMFQIAFQNSKEQNSYCKFLGVRSELLLSIDWYSLILKRVQRHLLQILGKIISKYMNW